MFRVLLREGCPLMRAFFAVVAFHVSSDEKLSGSYAETLPKMLKILLDSI
jgi:hypothetical protein